MKMNKPTAKQWIQLIDSAKAGNVKAFEEICRYKTSYIMFVCNNILCNWQDAEDATQEVLILLQEKIKTLETPEAFPAWLNRLSYNTSMMMRRKQLKNQYDISFEEVAVDSLHLTAGDLPAELLETKESRESVMKAVNSLPHNYRMALIFHYYEGLPVKDIAEVMDVSESAAKSYVFRGRAALKAKLESESPAKKSGKEYTTLSAMLPPVFDSTEMLIANQRSANVLQAMSIPLANTSLSGAGLSASVTTALKIAGGLVAGGAVVATVIVASGGMNSRQISPSLAVDQLPSAISTIDETDSSCTPEQSSAVVMGQISMHTPGKTSEERGAGVIGAVIQLVSAEDPDNILRVTSTMDGEHAGWYLFENLKPGDYRIKVHLPSHFKVMDVNDITLRDGFLSDQGNTVFSLKSNIPLSLNLWVTQTGSITGRITPEQPVLKNQLGGIVVDLYDAQNNRLAQTKTEPNGNYTFDFPPVPNQQDVTLLFHVPENLGVTLSNQKTTCIYRPGQIMNISEIVASDQVAPALHIMTGSGANPQNRSDAFLISATDAGPIDVQWRLFSGSNQVAQGNESTPGNQLDFLSSGDYLLVADATDRVGNTSTAQAIIRLA